MTTNLKAWLAAIGTGFLVIWMLAIVLKVMEETQVYGLPSLIAQLLGYAAAYYLGRFVYYQLRKR